MERESFYHVADLIWDGPVFQRAGRRPQRPVEHQLAVYLIQMGRTDALKSSDVGAVAEGTLYTYCDRISKALRRLKHDYLAWPGCQRRCIIKLAFGAKGFPGCIGVLDGSLIWLSNKPQVLGESYWCQKKMYAVSNLQHPQVCCVF
jgi:hypothetical protein